MVHTFIEPKEQFKATKKDNLGGHEEYPID